MLTIVSCTIVNNYSTLLNMNIKTKFGVRIKSLRLEKKLSQEKLANLAELDRTYMQSIEKGERNVSIITIEKLSIALNIPIYELLKSL